MNYYACCLICIFLFSKVLIAQDSALEKSISVSGNVQLTNNGIAPVPIFALGKPAIIGSAIIRRKRFYFNSELYFGLNAKPWTINSRFGFFIIDNAKWSINLASNLSLFFLQRDPKLNNNEEFQLQRYWANELNGVCKVTGNQSFQFQYWHTVDLDKLGIRREEFVNLVYAFDNVEVLKNFILGIRPSLFYLYDEKALEGVFVAQSTSFQRRNWKVNFFIQTALPVYVTPKNKFIWNAGLNIPF